MKRRKRSHSASSKKSRRNQSKNDKVCPVTFIVVLAILALAAYTLIYNSENSLGDPSDQFVVKTISKLYTSLDDEDPEEKNIFDGFRTSFLPPTETLFSGCDSKLSKREVYVDNVTTWRNPKKKQGPPSRPKRMSNFTFTDENMETNHGGSGDDDFEKTYKEPQTEFEPTTESSGDYYDDEELHRVMRPEPHMDRGPLDDVVEQMRGQPELEEEEMMVSAQVYKHGQTYKDIQAFWKGQGDKQTIRNTQARIMRQYMDAEADPCHDFYQYACGNWAALNPIPKDKAGYDTFEMLRENLDSVLRDILAFKVHEDVFSVYPGANLDLQDSVLLNSDKLPTLSQDDLGDNILNNKNLGVPWMKSRACFKNAKKKNSQIIERIRRYLEAKGQSLNKLKRRGKQSAQYKTPNTDYENRNPNKKHKKIPGEKYRERRNSRYLKNMDDTTRFGRKVLMYRGKRKTAEKLLPTSEAESTSEIPEPDFIDISPKNVKEMEPLDEDPAKGDATMKARFLFKSCMDYDILKKRGHQPLIDLLDILGGWPILNPKWDTEKFDWLELMAKLRLYNNDILLSEWVGPDIKNSNEFVIQFDQTSLGLPTRDYFLQDSNKVYLKAYKDYLIKIAVLLGGKPRHVRASADKLINFEIKLAKITSAPEDRRNVTELYRRMPLHKLEELVPEVKWRRYLSVVMDRDVKPDETVVMFALRYVRHLVRLIEETEDSILSNYLLWRFVRHRVNNLDDRFQSAKQQFYYVLFGREQSPPRWKNCIAQVNSNMGMALGAMFVRNHFDETSKNDTLKMTREIQNSFREILNKIGWIDEKTKALAAHKVDAMMLRIGYPDFILNKAELDDRYKEVTIHPSKYFENILNILQHLTKMEQGRLGQPVNKSLWNTAPAVVNAYYSRNKNQIMFPAGILQPPFYHRHFPRSLNYGGIGVVIGHEITHGFDDKGRLFDSDGNLHRWWSDSAIETFHLRAQCLIDQYGRYVVPEVNVKLDGVSTQGENIADNGGVKQAFRAYLHWLQDHGADDETLPGLNHTHTQLFFLNFAQVWCGAMRPEAMRNKLKTAVHSPGRFRVIGTLSNSHDFAREFRCPPGSPMNPTEKCSVW